MAVYTDVTDEALTAFLTDYDIGTVVAFRGVAEGVENAEQQRFLVAAGVHFLQGYRFGRPAPLDAITERLRLEQATFRMAARN